MGNGTGGHGPSGPGGYDVGHMARSNAAEATQVILATIDQRRPGYIRTSERFRYRSGRRRCRNAAARAIRSTPLASMPRAKKPTSAPAAAYGDPEAGGATLCRL